MALTPQQLASIANQNKKALNTPPPSYGSPPPIDEQINTMPNADKLTQTERKIYGALPGVSTWLENGRIAGKSYSEILDKFNNSWAGKGLQYLDVFAEGLERTAGLITQMKDPNFNFDELKSAWYAGSLTYDTMNLPQIIRSDTAVVDPVTGRSGFPVVGFRVPTDLPGATEGLQDARIKIQELMNQGYDAKEALSMVRDDYYGGLGALALRAQINDTLGHVLLDPLNFVSGWVKPLQAAKVKALNATTKIENGLVDVVTKLDEVAELARLSKNTDEALGFTNEAFLLAQASGDINKSIQYAEEAANLAKGLGKVEDATRYADEAAELKRIASNTDEATAFTQRAVTEIESRQVTQSEKLSLFLTGGDPLRPTAVGQKLRKIPGLNVVAKAMELTPQSKALEATNRLVDTFGSVISRLWDDPKGIENFVDFVHRVKKGGTGIEYGHAFLTPMGRSVQSLISNADFSLSNKLQGYLASEKYRNLLKVVSDTMGELPEKVLRLADENPTALLNTLKNIPNPAMANLIETGVLNADSLRALSKTFAGGVPYNKEMFFAEAMDIIETAAMRQAVIQYGVQAKGTITRWSDSLKAAESLAFLRLSPGYPIRNKINNDVTMISRGLFGLMGNTEMDDFWKAMKVMPQRLKEASLSMEAQSASKMSPAMKVLEDALNGTKGAPKIKEFIRDLSLGKLDAAAFSQKMESAARRKATTLGTVQYFNQYWKPKKVQEYFRPNVSDRMPTEIQDLINQAARSARGSDDILDEVLGGNLNLSVDSILDDATRNLGRDIRGELGAEILEYIHQRLPQAIKNGNVDAFKVEFRQKINQHIEDLFQSQVDDLVEHVKSQAVVGGHNVWNRYLSKSSDLMWGAQIERANRMPELTQLAREASDLGDYKLARSLWAQEAEDARVYYDRAFRRADAYINGLEQGASELTKRGANVPFTEIRKTFKDWKGNWEQFFKTKNKIQDEFFELFDNAPKGQKPSFDELRTKTQSLYNDAIRQEDAYFQKIDDTIASMMPDDVRPAFMQARDQLAELRKADKQSVLTVFEELHNAPKEERAAIMNEFWRNRVQRLEEIRRVEAESFAIQQGDPSVLQKYQTGMTETGEFNIYKLASDYGVATASETGVSGERSQKRILDIVNKYVKDEIEVAVEKGAGGSGSPQKVLVDLGGINEKEFSDIMGGVKGIDKQGVMPSLFRKDGMGIDDAGVALAERGFITEEQASDLNFVREFIRKNERGGSTKTFRETIEYTNVKDIPEDVARRAFDARAQVKVTTKAKVNPNYIADGEYQKILPDPQPLDLSMDLSLYGRSSHMIDSIVSSAQTASKKSPVLLKDLPPDLQNEIQRVIRLMKNDFAAERFRAMKFGEWRADSALLNYNRRTNFDNWLGHVAPFGFWTTNSMMMWALESIDRPAMLTNYLRAKKFLETSGLERDGMATRTKGKIRIELPFAPDWMGEQFIDPLRLMLPFDNWLTPFDSMKKDQVSFEGRVQRTLEQMLVEGKIDQDEFDMATEMRDGATWEFASSITKQNDESDRYDAWDFATALQMPHAPIMWAYNAAFGDEDDIGAFSPLSRIARNTATILGVEDWNNSKWNLEAKIRRQLGLNSYDGWDDYRIKRSASNLAGSGELTPDEAKEAIAIAALVEQGKMSAEEAKNISEAYRLSVERANDEFTGGVGGYILGLLGISVTSVPQGENNLRALQDDFGIAYEKYKNADDSLEAFIKANPNMDAEQAADEWAKQNPQLFKDADALRDFFDAHPEYETRLGLFDEPEMQIKKFMIDEVWATYNSMPRLNQKEVREHLGIDFQEAFLNPETRSYDDIPTELLSVWMKMMHADPLGGLTADQRILVSLYGKVNLTDPETANRVEVFYENRDEKFPNWYKKQQEYYSLQNPNQRKKYLQQNPDLKMYFDFRMNFMRDNPDLVPYLTDNKQAIERAKRQARTQNSVPTAQEIKINLPPDINELIYTYSQSGNALPPVLLDELEYYGQNYNLTGEQVYNIVAGGYGQR